LEERTTELTARLVISQGDALMQVVTIDKEAMTIGRRPYNDVCLDDLTVSGEHAVLRSINGERFLLDLNSRNGCVVNGIPVEKQLLVDGDVIDIGAFRLKFVIERLNPELVSNKSSTDSATDSATTAIVTQVNGRNRGKEVMLNQPITSLGKTGAHVAAIARRNGGFYITHIEGLTVPLINGEPAGIGSHLLKNGDAIELGGTMFRFNIQ
jgi:predicted component of type VI protein secretion system